MRIRQAAAGERGPAELRSSGARGLFRSGPPCYGHTPTNLAGSPTLPLTSPSRPRRTAVAGLLLVLATAGPAAAHPHIFIDGGADFVFDGQGRLAALDVTWIYDPFASLFMLEDLGIDPALALDEEARRRLAAYQTEWEPGFAGDSQLAIDGRPQPLSGPEAPTAELRDGRVVIRFRRSLETPVRPAPQAALSVYDPTYFTAYTVTEAPRLDGGAGCAAEVAPFEPTSQLATLQRRLIEIPTDGDPEDPQVGALFADRILLRCD